MDRLTNQFRNTKIGDVTSNIATPGKDRVEMEDALRADRLIRDLKNCAESGTQSATSKKRRKLVYANKFELDLEAERRAASASTSESALSEKIDKLAVTSWRMNEFEYVKGTLPSLARGLFTYQDPTTEETAYTKTTPAATNTRESHAPSADDSSTTTSKDGINDTGLHRILIRGYDKFFNVGEVDKTQLEWIADHTEGPYEVTLKENGCIIFMAGIPPQLVGPQGGCVVSSKHFLGELDQTTNKMELAMSHSTKGREWLERSLATKGKTLQEFGLWLWNHKLTAVAELCDDSFEEHVLEYPAERAGLYLHGLNRNTADFQTLPSVQVQEAAKEWGLWPTDYETFSTHQEVMDFAEKVRNAGEYDNRAVEGFVVRCKTKKEGNTHFFKIKYDEPYLMYREWREITKHLWAVEVKKVAAAGEATTHQAKSSVGSSSTSTAAQKQAAAGEAEAKKIRIRYPLTKPYVDFVKNLMQTQPALFVRYNKNQGIINIRDMFLKEWESKTTEQQDVLLAVPSSEQKRASSVSSNVVAEEDFQRTVLIPIATIGCGKTTISVALSKLFGWAHVSSDDFHHMRKNPGQKFINEVVNQLKEKMVVIADRNNFEYFHRERIMSAVRAEYPKTRFVALYWSHDDLPISRIHELEMERVKSRGSNHQSLTPEFCPEFETVIRKFLNMFQALNPMVEPDSNFSIVIESKVGEESLTFVKRIVEEFAIPTLGAGGIGNHSIPKPEEIEEAVRYALEDWKPKRVATGEAEKFHKQRMASQSSLVESSSGQSTPGTPTGAVMSSRQRKAKEPNYFGLSISTGAVPRFLEELFADGSKTTPEWARLKEKLDAWRADHRIGIHHHVTLIHTSARKDTSPKKAQRAEELWKAYTKEVETGLTSPTMSTVSSPTTSPRGSPLSDMSNLSTALDQSLTEASPASPAAAGGWKTVKKPGRGDKVQRVNAGLARSTSRAESSSPLLHNELQAEVVADCIIWTHRIMALRICSAKRALSGKPYDTTQAMLHVTVGTEGDHVKAYESNEVLRLWNNKMKHRDSGGDSAGPEVFWVKLETPKVFSAYLQALWF